MGELTDRERAVLDAARRWYRSRGARERDIRAEFGISPARFWQEVRALATRQEAVAYAPDVCRRYAGS